MAGAVVPLLINAAPELISLIVALVHKLAPAAQIEHGPGAGPLKFADVFVAVQTALIKAHAAGQIDTVPPDEVVKLLIQTVVTSLKALGLLTADVSPPVLAASQTLSLAPGQVVTIKAV